MTRYLKELKDSGEEITPKAWQREIDLLTAQKQVDTIGMKAMRENVTFPMAHPIAGQIVITVLLRQRFAHRQQRHDLLQQFDFQAALDCPFVVLLKAGCVLDGVLCFPHFFRSANNSSRSL